MSKKPKSKLIRLFHYIKAQWFYFITAVICGLYKFLLPFVMVWILGTALDIIIEASNELITIDHAWAQVLRLALLGGIALIVSPLPIYLRSLFAVKGTARSIKALRCDLFQHIYKLSHSFFDKNQTGALVSRIIGDIDNVSAFVSNALITIWLHIGQFIVIVIYLFLKNYILTLVALLLVPVQIILFRRVSRQVEFVSKNIRSKTAQLAGNTQEKLAGVTVVKTFTGETHEIERFEEYSDSIVAERVKAGHYSGISQAIIQFLNNLGPLMILLCGSFLSFFYPQFISIGSFVQFVMLQRNLSEPFSFLSNTIIIAADAMGALDRIFQLLDLKSDVQDRPQAIMAPHFSGRIAFKDVCFAYPGEEKKIIDHMSFEIAPKSTVAFVGESGGGKTTIVNLLNRFYEITNGSVTIDGIDIRDFKIRSLRSRIALVPQDPVLFSGTIRENVLYGWPEAGEEELQQAVQQAYAAEFIDKLPLGLDTLLGERGVNLSGGQKQRLAIARAFLKQPSILILDEATSALDAEGESMVQQALEKLLQNRTTLVIAHRLSTVMRADSILVIEQGRIVEQGTHEELSALKGRYFALCGKQFGGRCAPHPGFTRQDRH